MGFAAAVSLMLWASFSLSRSSAWVPQWVLAITLALLLLQMAAELWALRKAADQAGSPAAKGRSARTVAATSWLGVLLLLTWLLGSAPGGAVFCCAWLRGHAGERWSVSVAIAAALGVVLWLLFTAFLGVGLYPGVLWFYFSL
jgi:Tripartite tricarboxylate transporter TctB family